MKKYFRFCLSRRYNTDLGTDGGLGDVLLLHHLLVESGEIARVLVHRAVLLPRVGRLGSDTLDNYIFVKSYK